MKTLSHSLSALNFPVIGHQSCQVRYQQILNKLTTIHKLLRHLPIRRQVLGHREFHRIRNDRRIGPTILTGHISVEMFRWD